MSPETKAAIAAYQQKIAAGTITDEELKEGLRLLREDRVAAASASASSRARKAPVDADALLKDFEDL